MLYVNLTCPKVELWIPHYHYTFPEDPLGSIKKFLYPVLYSLGKSTVVTSKFLPLLPLWWWWVDLLPGLGSGHVMIGISTSRHSLGVMWAKTTWGLTLGVTGSRLDDSGGSSNSENNICWMSKQCSTQDKVSIAESARACVVPVSPATIQYIRS